MDMKAYIWWHRSDRL